MGFGSGFAPCPGTLRLRREPDSPRTTSSTKRKAASTTTTRSWNSSTPRCRSSKGAAYLFAGQSRLDLPLLLEKLERLGIHRLMLTGGGAMNWSFLQTGCIDELSIVLAPAVSAEPEAALFDRSRFLPGGEAKGFQLIEAKALEDGAVWLR